MATSLDQSDFMKTALRFPRDLHARLQASAEASGASLNSEILRLLREALDGVKINDQSLDAIEDRFRRSTKHK
jgi:Mg2+ and Co2+ transporter CorA